MKFILGSILRIVDDRIPVATRGVGATVGCGGDPPVAPTGFVPVIINKNRVAKRKRCKYRYFGNHFNHLVRRFKITCNGANGCGDDFLIFVLSSSVGVQNFEPLRNFEPLQFCPPIFIFPYIRLVIAD